MELIVKCEDSPLLNQASRWVIGFSGGVDSQVLLNLANESAKEYHKKIIAVHIHHGLNPKADEWAAHCKKVCAELQLPCHIIKIKVNTENGASLEAAAREARYQALAEFMQPGDILLTGHHQDDQAETLLLQLMRGAGVKGLAAMGLDSRLRENDVIVRPLLHTSRNDILAYAKQHNLQWIHDDSNDNTRFDRNFLRQEILPKLTNRWPQAVNNMTRSAEHCAEADDLLMQLGRQDYQPATKINKLNLSEFLTQDIITRLAIKPLVSLSNTRLKNALRTWLHDFDILMPSEIKLQHIIQDMLLSADDANPVVSWSDIELRRFNHELYLCKSLPSFDTTKTYQWDLKSDLVLSIGTLTPAGLEQAKITKNFTLQPGKIYTIRFRQGGEQFHPADRTHSQSLKKLFQEWQIPTWLRDRTPLLYDENSLVAVLLIRKIYA